MAEDWKKLLSFRCTCCGNCCREPIVLVTDEDIRRVQAHTRQPAHKIVDSINPAKLLGKRANRDGFASNQGAGSWG